MKKAEEYLKGYFEEPFELELNDENSIEYEFLQIFKQIQRDAIDEAVKRCAKAAKLKTVNAGHIDEFIDVDRPAILRVAKKLRKEIQ